MNVVFITLVEIGSLDERGIYQDLLRKFLREGHHVTVITPVERRKKLNTNLIQETNYRILKVKTLNIQKTNIIEKGIGTLAIEYQYLAAINKHLSHFKFDLVLYSTPPITFERVVRYFKRRDNAYAYLLLKDIFPQNAIDMKMMREGGILHRYFLKKERRLYMLSDTIGCMSPANVAFLLKYNPYLESKKIEVNPNSIEPASIIYTSDERDEIRRKYNIPLENKVFAYGGNLGKPQGVDFLLQVIEKCNNKDAFFLIVGDGTEFSKLQEWFRLHSPQNAALLRKLPKDDYNRLLASCDVGLIFLARDFLIPNFPSRLLSYLEMKKPVIAATDCHMDIGDVVENARCGYRVLAGDLNAMNAAVTRITDEDDLLAMGENAWRLLQRKYLVNYSYQLIVEKLRID